jgi:ABC-type sugar transport system permease subunit
VNQLILLITDIFKLNFFPLLAAILLFFVKNLNTANIMKKLLVFPMLVPAVVVFLMFANIYSPTMGALNAILELIGLEHLQHDWLNDGSTALAAIIFIGFPFVSGLYFLIYHAGLNNIPKEIIEAAKIDGCRSAQLIRHILLPSIRVYIGTCIMLITIGSMQDYVKILVTTGGGPRGYETYTPAVMLYKRAFDSGQLGYASSIGVVMFIIIMVLTIITFQLTKAKDEN